MSKILNLRLQSFSIFKVLQEFEVRVLEFILLDEYDFAVLVSSERSFLANFNNNSSFFIANRHKIRLSWAVNTPHRLQPVVEEGFVLEGIRVPDIKNMILTS